MPKTDERLTAANLVFYYTFSNLSTAGELDSWFIGFLSASEGLIEISRIRLHNLYSRHAEEGGPAELNLPKARMGVLKPMREAGANRLSVYFTYHNVPMVLGVTLGAWEVSISAPRSDADQLTELSGLLNFD